jgi:hypothetical protein
VWPAGPEPMMTTLCMFLSRSSRLEFDQSL